MANSNPNRPPPNQKKGKKSPGSGPPPSEFKEWCKKLLHSPKTRKFISDLVSGEPIEEVQKWNGERNETVMVSAPAQVRQRAIEWLADRGEGKVPQAVVGEDGGPVTVQIVNYAGAK